MNAFLKIGVNVTAALLTVHHQNSIIQYQPRTHKHMESLTHSITYFDPFQPVINKEESYSILRIIGNEFAPQILNVMPLWNIVPPTSGIPTQANDGDCGVFVIVFMFCLVFDIPLNSFNANNIPFIRKKLVAILLHERVLEHKHTDQ